MWRKDSDYFLFATFRATFMHTFRIVDKLSIA